MFIDYSYDIYTYVNFMQWKQVDFKSIKTEIKKKKKNKFIQNVD